MAPQTQSQSVQKIITFSTTLYYNAVQTANKKGITFQDYIRHLLVKDIEEKKEPLYVVDAKTEKEIGQALDDVAHNRGTLVRTDEELEKHLKMLDEEML